MGWILFDADSETVFPILAAYFFITGLVFVVGVQSLAPIQLRTRWPGVYFPTDRDGWRFMFRVWGRMLMWFFGAACTAALVSLIHWLVT